MPSSYTTNNGIELIATGEQSGTWGDTTNTNLSLIDTSLDGQVTVTLPSAGNSGSPNDIDIVDGTASNGRNRLIIFNDGSDLGATAYVRLTPSDAEKIVYIRNSLSGSRSILAFQGTYNASNDYEIPSGTTAVIYFDGAGSGAVAANVFDNAYFDSLRLGSISVTAILDEDDMVSDSATALATQQSIKAYVDSQVGASDTLAEILATGNTTGGTDIAVSAADDITFADNSKAIFGAGSDLQIYHSGTNSFITDAGTGSLFIQGEDLTLRGADASTRYITGVQSTGAVTAFYGNSAKLATTSTGVDVTGTVVSDGLTVDSSDTYAVDVSRPTAGNTTLRITSGSTAGDDAVLRADIGNTTGTSAVYFGDTATNGIGRIAYEHNGDYMRFYTSSTEKMRIDSSGNVGIGTTSPSVLLDLTSTNPIIRITDSDTGADTDISGANSSGSLYLDIDKNNTAASSNLQIDIDGSEVMRIDSSGNVGIGTSSPGCTLDVSNDAAAAANNEIARLRYTTSTTAGHSGDLNFASTAGTILNRISSVIVDGSNVSLSFSTYESGTLSENFLMQNDGDFHADGDVIAYSTTISDERLKEDVKVVESALDKVKQLRGVTFKYKTDGKVSAGVIAQDVEKVLPEAVTEKEIPLKQDDGQAYKTVRYDALHALMIEAIKELSDEVARLKGDK